MVKARTETKDNILAAARTLLSFHGYGSTAMEDILNAAGVSKGAFYHHFKSKEQLCCRIIEQVRAEYEQLAESVSHHGGLPADRLGQWLTSLLEQRRLGRWVNCQFITRLSMELGRLGPELQGRLGLFWQWYHGFYEDMMAQCGLDRRKQAPLAARLLISTLCSAVWLEQACPSNHTTEDLAEMLIKAVLAEHHPEPVRTGRPVNAGLSE